jgi:hypothetical protein
VPIIISASEDGTVKIWHNTTYRLETSLNYGMDRAWALGYVRESNAVAIGYDNGLVLLKLGNDEPVASMDSTGKIVYARNNDILSAAVKALGPDYQLADGERLPLPVKVLHLSGLAGFCRFEIVGYERIARPGVWVKVPNSAMIWKAQDFNWALLEILLNSLSTSAK